MYQNSCIYSQSDYQVTTAIGLSIQMKINMVYWNIAVEKKTLENKIESAIKIGMIQSPFILESAFFFPIELLDQFKSLSEFQKSLTH